jgi:hypothetical protein
VQDVWHNIMLKLATRVHCAPSLLPLAEASSPAPTAAAAAAVLFRM